MLSTASAYTAVIEGVGGEKPYTWSVTNGGGTGFGINNEGILSGIAPRSGDYGLSLRLTDNANTQATASFVLTVTGDTPQPLAISHNITATECRRRESLYGDS